MAPQPMPPLASYEDLAGRITHSLLAPDLNTTQVMQGLEMARRYRVASVVVRPCDIDLAVRTLGGGSLKPASVVGFPHGSENTAAKLFEGRDLLRRGARQIDLVISISKLLSREFQYVQMELSQMSESCHQEGAIFEVTLETAYLTEELKIIACRCCERAEVDFVKTSTGYAPSAYTLDDLRLLRKYLPEEIGVEAQGGWTNVAEVLTAYEAGASRIATASSASLLDEWKASLTTQTRP